MEQNKKLKRSSSESTRQSLIRYEEAYRTVDIAFVREEAGDTEMTPERQKLHEELRKKRGDAFYSDLLLVLTHNYYPHEVASKMWEAILAHKWSMSKALGRNVRIMVAALDYLSNIDESMPEAVLVSERRMATVAEVALRDGLTGLLDHETFINRLRSEMLRSRRYGSPVSLIMLDMDYFKKINDTLGHQEGDKVLAVVGGIIKHTVRDVDIPARYGGEEFAVIAPQTSIRQGMELAERLRTEVQNSFQRMGFTISGGVAAFPEHSKKTNGIIRAADAALYLAKQQGRNRIVSADAVPKTTEKIRMNRRTLT